MLAVEYLHYTAEPLLNFRDAESFALGAIFTRASWGAKEVLASAVILVCIAFAYLYFRG